MGVSENSVPLNPMVLLIIIPIKWLFHWEYTLFSDKPKSSKIQRFYQLCHSNSWTQMLINFGWDAAPGCIQIIQVPIIKHGKVENPL